MEKQGHFGVGFGVVSASFAIMSDPVKKNAAADQKVPRF
jgi:hypothetical protein